MLLFISTLVVLASCVCGKTEQCDTSNDSLSTTVVHDSVVDSLSTVADSSSL